MKAGLMAGCAFACLSVALPASAQQAKTDTDDKATIVEEVIVTTERRSVNVQETPLAVTAYTDKTRENLGIISIQSLAQFSPGVSYSAAADRPTIRGVGRANNSHGLNSPVAQYLDGFYVSTVQDTARRPIFVDRVEVVSGPQGALAGKGSAAGAIYTYLKRPKDTFQYSVGGYAGNYRRTGVEGTVTGPITDWLRYRVNLAVYNQDAGYFRNVEDGHTEGSRFGSRSFLDVMFAGNVGEKIDWFVKGSGQWYNDDLHDTAVSAPFSSTGVNNPCIQSPYNSPSLTPSNVFGTFATGTSTSCGAFTSSTGATGFNPNAVIYGAGVAQNPWASGGDIRDFANNYHSTLHIEGYFNGTAEAVYHAKLFDTKYIVGWSRYHYTQSSDADGSPVNTQTIPTSTTAGVSTTRVVNANGYNVYTEEPDWYSNEVTFASTWKGPLQGIVGLYQYNQYTKQPTSTQVFDGFPELANPWYISVVNPTLGLTAPSSIAPANVLGRVTQYGNQITRQQSWAAFTQWDYKFNDKWTFTAGLRYNSDKEFAYEEARDIANNPAVGGGANNSLISAGGPTVSGPYAADVSSTFFPGFAVVASNAAIPPGYRVVDPATVGTPSGTCNGGASTNYVYALINACGNQLIQFGPGVHGVSVNPVTGNRERTESGKWSAVTGGFSLSYKPTEDGLIYLRYAKGYRPGGFGATTAGFLPLNPYADQEALDTYELGAKFTFFSRLQLDADLFQYDYKNIQVQLSRFERCVTPGDISSCTAVSGVVNLPSGEVKGFELTSRWYVTNDLLLTLNYGFLDAHIKNGLTADAFGFQDTNDPAALLPGAVGRRLNEIRCTTGSSTCRNASGTTTGIDSTHPGYVLDPITRQHTWTQDLSGNTLPNSPKHKLAANASYTFHLNKGELVTSYSWIYRTKAYSQPDVFEEEPGVTKAYSQSDARLIFREKNDKYSIILYGTNIFNQNTYESGGLTRRGDGSVAATPLTPGNIATSNCQVVNGACAQNQIFYPSAVMLPPRTFGIEFLKKFR